MSRPWLVTGAVLGALGVALGAFGAHLLRTWLPLQSMTIYETAIHYLQIHTLALLATGVLLELLRGERWLVWAASGFAAGCVLFSGSLIALALTGWTWFGAITPIGGVLWIGAWVALAVGCGRGTAKTLDR